MLVTMGAGIALYVTLGSLLVTDVSALQLIVPWLLYGLLPWVLLLPLLLPLRLHPFLSPAARERNRALNALAIAPAHRAAPWTFTRRHVALCRRAIEKWDALLERWYAGPLTLSGMW